MGVYDIVKVPCPACETIEFFQTKSGPCELTEYDLKDCPEDVLQDVNRHSPYECIRCNTSFYVNVLDKKSLIYTEEIDDEMP
jgi:hypothetical protein